MKIKIDDNEIERITVKCLKRSLKFLRTLVEKGEEEPNDDLTIEAIEDVLRYYE